MSDGLRIELETGANPITGRVCPESGQALPFSGYVELIAALEGLRLAEQPDDSPSAAES